MGLSPLAGTGPLCPDRQTLGGRRNARRRPPKKFAHHRRFQKSTGAKGAGKPCAAACPGEKERCLLRQTANYQLSQWDAEDRILREDFNSDNQKIDETMAALKAGNYFEKLADVTTTQSCQQLDVDLSGVDFTQYDRLIIHPMIKTDTVHSAILRLNGRSDTIYSRGDHFATFCTSYNSGIGGGEVEITLDTFLLGRNLYAEPGDPRPTVNELFLVRKSDDRLVGMIDFRRPLTEFLLRFQSPNSAGHTSTGIWGESMLIDVLVCRMDGTQVLEQRDVPDNWFPVSEGPEIPPMEEKKN